MKPLKDHAACGNCDFWQPLPPGSDDGRYRIHPPEFHLIGGDGSWPRTHKDDYCGEFRELPRTAGVKPILS